MTPLSALQRRKIIIPAKQRIRGGKKKTFSRDVAQRGTARPLVATSSTRGTAFIARRHFSRADRGAVVQVSRLNNSNQQPPMRRRRTNRGLAINNRSSGPARTVMCIISCYKMLGVLPAHRADDEAWNLGVKTRQALRRFLEIKRV